mmetsp:Transcript_8525/g.24077  ORF Transcript_8525/g.24077 Transcript_8525/m.24077 type:complete len:339 (+) Transcript_8525:317-1333(+)
MRGARGSTLLCMLCLAPCRRMNTMNSCRLTSPDWSASSAFHTDFRSASEICLSVIPRQGRGRRTIFRSSSKAKVPDWSQSTMRNTLYQFPRAWCRCSAAWFIWSTTRDSVGSSASGHVSRSSLYIGSHHSLAVTSPEALASTWPQRARRSSWDTPSMIVPFPGCSPPPMRVRSAAASSWNVSRLLPLVSHSLKNSAQLETTLKCTPCERQCAALAFSSARAVACSCSRVRSGTGSAGPALLSSSCCRVSPAGIRLWKESALPRCLMKPVNWRVATLPVRWSSRARQKPRMSWSPSLLGGIPRQGYGLRRKPTSSSNSISPDPSSSIFTKTLNQFPLQR